MKQFFFLILVSAIAFFPGCFNKGAQSTDNHKKAMYWSLRSAEGGSASAQNMLGAKYYLGDGVPKDFKKAYVWYKLAANQGDTAAKKFVSIITALLPEDQFAEAQILFSVMQNKIMNSK